MIFVTEYEKIADKINQVDPIKYGQTRNFTDGAVTYLSPYISRGVISTRQVFDAVIAAGYKPYAIEKFIQELAWRDYWQQIWIANTSAIDKDLKHPQPLAFKAGIPANMLSCQTGIMAIDNGIEALYQTGYIHNHIRMYIASLTCNVARYHWQIPAQWMYYYLLDADWASNALSWQWVCGANSHKLYYANQQNINKYCYTSQQNTFLDIPYDAFEHLEIPAVLDAAVMPEFITPLPQISLPALEPNLPVLIYNFYNLDPHWRSGIPANRILLLEPSVFKKYPVSKKSIDFTIALATQNIPGIKMMVAEFADLQAIAQGEIYYKEHPLNNYKGCEDARTWMTNVKGEFPSFFAFWKKCKKELF